MNSLLASILPLAAILGMSPPETDIAQKAEAPLVEPAAPNVAVQPSYPAPEPLPAVEKTAPVAVQPEPTPVKIEQPAPAAPPIEQHKLAEPPVFSDQQDLSNQPDLIEEKPVEATREDILAGASQALSGAKTAKGMFVQTDSYGGRESGEFYIRRPNRVRFEYGSPMRLLVVSDGTTVHYEDFELETENSAPLSATPLKLFLDKNIDLSTDRNVVDVKALSDRYVIVVEDKRSDIEERVDGQLWLMFAKESFDLMGWLALDAAGAQTRVDLLRVEKNAKVGARLFVIEDEDDDRRR